ncbi:lysosome-associated membrane glycoprotein 1 [Bufo bufo]|uniref:lysosome-associated membrane glycoprotein 1 n=1 Tax=Bufo bufo TaxID=8384 RepID=UPI001ABEBE26|nr:lysosome-associated membrane glycoprotein 1 [Bufo bufo]
MTSSRMRMLGEAALGIALLFGIFQSGCSGRFEVKDASNKTCILADLSINFTVEYKKGAEEATVPFPLPDNAVVSNMSTCSTVNATGPLLAIAFGSGHSLSMHFAKSDAEYQVKFLTLTYNLSDSSLFPDSAENGTKQVSSNHTEISAKTNRFYQCASPHLIIMGSVNATFQNVKLEAYLNGNNYSVNASLCKEDVTPTTAPTSAPTTVAPTTPPVNPPTPSTGDYRVNTSSGAACILASMGLQLNITYKTKDDKDVSSKFNIPKQVKYDGNCSATYATLIISYEQVYLLFNFSLNATENKFYLGQVHVNTTFPDAKEPIDVDSGSVSFLQTTTHKSYKCNAKQTLQITDKLYIDTYNLQVQAFDIDDNKFGPVVECAADQNGMLVPIIVGAALAGLVLIVLIAYLVGRKRSHAGYQTI